MEVPYIPHRPAVPPGLDSRSAAVLREIVEQYVETGGPVGSRTLSRRLQIPLSPATIRNVMADLTEAGLLFAPHTSAGRLPTDRGLRLFVDGLLQFGDISPGEREQISAALEAKGRSLQDTLGEVSSMLSGLSAAAGLVLAPKSDAVVRHIEFVPLGPGRALVILVSEDGQVENRVIEIPPGLPPSSLTHASNYLNAQLSGRSLGELRLAVSAEMLAHRSQLDELSAMVVEAGLATWTGEERGGSLIIRGQGPLALGRDADRADQRHPGAVRPAGDAGDDAQAAGAGRAIRRRADLYRRGERSVRRASGVSMVVAPARNEADRIVGAIGVIGPTRINYGRIIPVVDFTARVIGRLLG